MNDYIHKAEQLCESMHLEEKQKLEIKKSLGSINAQLLNIKRNNSSQRSIVKSGQGSRMFIDLDDKSLINRKYMSSKKTNARYGASDQPIVQKSMY